MNETFKYLLDKIQSELTYSQYQNLSRWYISHFNELVTNYPFLKLGNVVKATINDEVYIFKVKDFIISHEGILLDTGFGNVYYYETFEADEKDIKIFNVMKKI